MMIDRAAANQNPGNPEISIAIVVPVYNRREITVQCLRSLSDANVEGFKVHVIMVDGGSTDGTSRAVNSEFPAVQIIRREENLGYTEGTNVGVRAALETNPDYVLTMNDDQVFDSEFLQFMVETARKYPRSIVGALLLLWGQPHRVFQVAPVWNTFTGGWRHWLQQTVQTVPGSPWKVELIVGNCVLVPRSAYAECGLMDSKRFWHYGDAEFTPRLRKRGWTLIVDPRARVFCQPNDMPPAIRSMNLKQQFNLLFIDLTCGKNLRNRLQAYLRGAPSKLHGLAGFAMFLLRVALGRNFENPQYAGKFPEMSLKERFRSQVLDEKKGNLVFLWSYTQWGGAQTHLFSIIRQAAADWNLRVALPQGTSPDFLRFLDDLKVEYDLLNNAIDLNPARTIGRKIRRRVRAMKVSWETWRYFRRYGKRGDIFHVDFPPWQSWILLYLLTRRGKVFVTLHNALGSQPSWRRWLWKKRLDFLMSLNNFHLLASNQHTTDYFRVLIDEKYWSKIGLVTASINPEELNQVLENDFRREEVLTRIGLAGKERIVLCVGQFVDRKGRWIFLEAAQKLFLNNPAIGFVWLMPELPTAEEFERIEGFGLGDSFQAVKSADVGNKRIDVLNFFRIADIFALASLLEGLPFALLEAMGLGICSVSTRVNAIPEAVRNLETGILIEPGNVEALVSAIDCLFADDELREKIAGQGRKFVLKNFDENFWAQVAVEKYCDSLGNRKTDAPANP